MSDFMSMIGDARKHKASDLHLVSGMPPVIRVNGEIISLAGYDQLSAESIEAMLLPLMDECQQNDFTAKWRLCFSRNLRDLGYFRVSVYRRAGRMEAAIRLGIMEVPSFEELGLPSVIEEISRSLNGLILVTGSTGAGKTTTFNAMLDFINRERRGKIITIEDPIEYVHRPVRSLVIQQEVGTDVKSFPDGLLHALRQDPDVIGLGELRELDTISSALTAAETGHLVLATLHTNDAVNTVNRIVDVFSGHQQQQIRYQLAQSLQAVINQRLLPRVDQEGRVLACEIMIANEAVRNMIRDNKIHQLASAIATGGSYGMKSLASHAEELHQKGMIGFDTMESCLPKRQNGHKVSHSAA